MKYIQFGTLESLNLHGTVVMQWQHCYMGMGQSLKYLNIHILLGYGLITHRKVPFIQFSINFPGLEFKDKCKECALTALLLQVFER